MNITKLQSLLRYDPTTGYIYRISTGRRVYEEPHGGYTRIEVGGRRYRTHRIAWALYCGEWPNTIDHLNHDRADNRIDNLRNTNVVGNQRNMKKSARNQSGVTGVSWDKRANKWYAKICVGRVQKHLGLFDRLEDAVAARKVAETEAGFHPNHGM